jgi:hypothetical protein
MMIDDENNNMGVGTCEFEAVDTPLLKFPNGQSIDYLGLVKARIGLEFYADDELIFMDMPNSLQSKYMRRDNMDINTIKRFKLIIPFKLGETPTTNEIHVMFSQKDLSPNIIASESKAYSSKSGQSVAYSVVDASSSGDGKFICVLSQHIVPSRLELVLDYTNTPWEPMTFFMKWYVFSATKGYTLPSGSGQDLKININKIYNVFVESERDAQSEHYRAYQVLKNWSNNQGES